MKKYKCNVCEWVYDPAIGDPESGIAPGTAFEDLPEDWVCPVGGEGKGDSGKVNKKQHPKLKKKQGERMCPAVSV